MDLHSVSLVDFVPTNFIASVEEAGLKDLAEKLRLGEYVIAEVSDALKEHPALLAEFAGYVQAWRDENGYGDDERPDSTNY